MGKDLGSLPPRLVATMAKREEKREIGAGQECRWMGCCVVRAREAEAKPAIIGRFHIRTKPQERCVSFYGCFAVAERKERIWRN